MIINPLTLYSIIFSAHLLLGIIIVSFFVKIYFLALLVLQGMTSYIIRSPWIFLFGTLAGSMFGDIAWIVKLSREIFTPNSSYMIVIFFIRIAWAFLVVQYQSLTFFIQSLIIKKFTMNRFHTFLLMVSSGFVFYFLYLALFDLTLIDETTRELAKQYVVKAPLEIKVMRCVVAYLLSLLILPALYLTCKKIKSTQLPKILKKQLKIFIQYLLIPYFIVEFLQGLYFIFHNIHTYLYPIASISTLMLTYTIYYCMKKVMTFRFLNITQQVQSLPSIDIINDFKNALEQLGHATTLQELSHITQIFFKEAFAISSKNNTLYIRNLASLPPKSVNMKLHKVEILVENFLRIHHQTAIYEFMRTTQILVYDEIAFNHFYEETSISTTIIKFLEKINADVFIPIYTQNKITAYLIIDKGARINECYSKTEHDEMLVFINYLANTINLLQNKNIEILLLQEKELEEEIYFKHQEINQYKESIRSFFRSRNQPKQAGIIFYKNKYFTYGNQIAKELIKINLNYQEGHPLTKIFRNIAQQVSAYKSPLSCLNKDTKGNTLVITGIPHLDQSSVILTVSYPDIADIIKKKIEYLNNPAQWNHLLYLETTDLGDHINKFIPGSGEVLLNFKIELLKMVLRKKAILLDAPEKDLLPIVKLLHHLSNRQTLHVLNLQESTNNTDVTAQLFGINSLFGSNKQEYPLLTQLNKVGTLFVKNVHFLDQKTEEYLGEFIRYGFYRVFESDQKVSSNVRIICSTHQNIQQLIQENETRLLFSELKKNRLTMPSLITLPDEELLSLADGFLEQAIKTTTFKNLFSFTEKEKSKLLLDRPVSLQEFKIKIQHLLIQKSKKSKIYQETQFDPAYTITDPELIIAAQLGKHALKDQKIMSMLWNKFQNQNKIAIFLGVNRSSVNRRCKEYKLR